MEDIFEKAQPHFLNLTAEVVSAYVANNSLQKTEIPSLIAAVYSSLAGLGHSAPIADIERPVPKVPIRKSVNPDYIISLEDGRHYKTLKRHLSGHGMTPEQYRSKWNLPASYPMVAPNYAKQRSDLAKSTGLGRHRGDP